MDAIRFSLLGVLFLGLCGVCSDGVEAKEPTWSYSTGDDVKSVDISADGEYMVTIVYEHLYLFGKDSSNPLWTYDSDNDFRSVAISADGEYIVAGSADYSYVYLFNKDSSTPLWSYQLASGSDVFSVAISADGEYIVAGSADDNVYLFSKVSSSPLWTYDTGSYVISVDISADGEYIIAGKSDFSSSKIYLFNKDSNAPLWSYATNEQALVTISADGEYIVSLSDYDKIHLFNKDSSTPLLNCQFSSDVSSADISADGEYIVAGTSDDFVYLFDKDNGCDILWSYDTDNDVSSVAISANGQYIIAGTTSGWSSDGRVHFFNKDGTLLWFYENEAGIAHTAISADGHRIIVGEYYGSKIHFFSMLPPTATIDSISPSPARFENTEVTFSGSGSDSDGIIASYYWESDMDGFLSNEKDFSLTGFSIGTHTIYFCVRDNDGFWSDWVTAELIINPNEPPVAEAIHWNDPAGNNFELGATITFTGTGTDEDGTIVLYEWDFDSDGTYDWTSSENGTTTFSYNNDGTYTATLRVTDNDGDTATDSRIILIGIIDEDEGFIPAPSLIAALGVLLAVARRRR